MAALFLVRLIADLALNKWKDWRVNSLFPLVHVYFWAGI